MSDVIFPFYKFEGTVFEVGLQHGTSAAERVHKSLDFYRLAFLEKANLQWAKALEIAESFVPVIKDYDPGSIEEIKGIAQGSDCKFQEIMAINCRSEIMYMSQHFNDGCTTVAVLPEASENGVTLLGQNWDFRSACLETTILTEIHRKEGMRSFNFIEAGMLARNGMNSAGIGVVGNFLLTNRDRKKSGIPFPFVRRRLLASKTIFEAMETVIKAEKSSSNNTIIGTYQGFAIDIEATPEHFYHIYPDNGLLVHTNHFLADLISEKDINKYRMVDTLYRDWRLKSLLKSKMGHISAEDIRAALSDHFGYPRSICRHKEPEMKASEMLQTVGSIIMDLNRGKIIVAAGCPCEADYKNFELEMSIEG
jgi:isopenicillin-N N-acyltransferase-like protein